MKKIIVKISLAFLCIVSLSLSSYTIKSYPKSIANFSLLNVDGKSVSLKDYPNAKGFIIVFTCNHCPFAKLYPQRMNDLNKEFAPLQVPLIAISSTDTIAYEEDTFDKMIEKSKAEHFNFPYLFDGEQKVAKAFYAQKTPHAFILWKEGKQWAIKYNGAIDDNGANPDKVEQHYVKDAVNALLAGKSVAIKETKSIGCQIRFRK